MEYLEECSRVGEGGFGPKGVTFRGSTQKTVPHMQFAPTNLHLQEMRVGACACVRPGLARCNRTCALHAACPRELHTRCC